MERRKSYTHYHVFNLQCSMKKTLLASLLAATSLSAFAADYYVVVPVKGKTNSLSAIKVALQAATLPVAKVGQAYSYDLAQHLLVTGDPTLNLSQATLSTADALPSGLSLASNGVLSGTPTTKTPGASFQVVATYKTQTGQQAYTIVVNGATLDVTQIVGGDYHACAVTTAGGAKCWGNNAYGQLGDNSTINRLTPVDVTGLTSGVSSVGVGRFHTCAVTTAGGVKCWGYNGEGQLGDNSTTIRLTPVDVTGLTSGVSSVGAGANHACAVTTAGGVKCWGRNDFGQLGDNSTVRRLTPVDVSGVKLGVSSVGVGRFHSCAVKSAGVV